MRHKVGIYSLSRTPLDELMWAHYGNSHASFCIEYDLDRLILEARTMWDVVDVAYYEDPQTLILHDIAKAPDTEPTWKKWSARSQYVGRMKRKFES